VNETTEAIDPDDLGCIRFAPHLRQSELASQSVVGEDLDTIRRVLPGGRDRLVPHCDSVWRMHSAISQEAAVKGVGARPVANASLPTGAVGTPLGMIRNLCVGVDHALAYLAP
jgi:hypothetical protein